jgi:hypothetical protein
MTPQEERLELLKEFVACGQEVSGIVSKYMDFLKLRPMIFNESERQPIEEITDNLGVALGALEEAWEQAYAFEARMESEEELRRTGNEKGLV